MYEQQHINPESFAAKLWLATGKSIEELEELVCATAQDAFIKAAKPTKEQVDTWKASSNGMALLQEHIRQVIGHRVSLDTLEALWRYYTGRTVKVRKRRNVQEFITVSDRQLCRHCGTDQGPFHVDHKIPLALGGSDNSKNLQILCAKCNQKKGMRVDVKVPFIQIANYQ